MRTPSRAFSLSSMVLILAVLAGSTAMQAAGDTLDETTGSVMPPPVPAGGVGCEGSVNADLCNIDHIIMIVQENRSFDHYFGIYKNPNGMKVAGIPRKPSGRFKPCIPHPVLGRCVRPFKTASPVNLGGPHALVHSKMTINGGKMDGAIEAAYSSTAAGSYHCVAEPFARDCRKFNNSNGAPDLMSTLGRRTIPNYWAYANRGVLQDHMFAPTDGWSLPAHLFLFSGWSAECNSGPMSCKSAIETHNSGPYMWTDITYLLHENGITWKNYVGEETNITCPKWPCPGQTNRNGTPWIWNVLPNFQTVRDNNQVQRTQPVSEYFTDAEAGTLPKVSWVLPSLRNSEHPAHGSLMPGQNHVTRLVNAAAKGPDWESTVIFLVWDDWGGFYDHIQPPKIDKNGYGLRVPGLVLGPYVKKGWVDHQTFSYDAYLKFIEDRFLSGERLNPNTLSRPDARPTVRENVDRLGDLIESFDFTQTPRPPEDFILDPASGKHLPNPAIPPEWVANDPFLNAELEEVNS